MTKVKMNLMRFYRLLISFTFVFATLFSKQAFAIEINPSAGDFEPSTEYTVGVFIPATMQPTEANAAELSLEITNGEIIDFAPNLDNSYIATLGTGCNGAELFSQTKVCAALVRTKTFIPGSPIGTITFKTGKSGVTTISGDNENKLVFGAQSQKYLVSTNYNIISPATDLEITNSPVIDSGTTNNNSLSYGLIGFGILSIVVAFAILFFKVAKKKTLGSDNNANTL